VLLEGQITADNRDVPSFSEVEEPAPLEVLVSPDESSDEPPPPPPPLPPPPQDANRRLTIKTIRKKRLFFIYFT